MFLGIFLNNTRIEKVSVYPVTNSFRSEAATQRFSLKKVVLKKFAKFTGKRLCQGLFFSKVAGAVYVSGTGIFL